jgi:hypothetical protein
LRHAVERLLDGVDAVLYLLDYTKLKTADEAGLFGRLAAVNPALLARLSQRLFFAVNKVCVLGGGSIDAAGASRTAALLCCSIMQMDAAEVSEGQDEVATREYVAALVTRQMGVPGFQLQPHQVKYTRVQLGV